MALPSPSSSSALLNLLVRILEYSSVEVLVGEDSSYSTLVSEELADGARPNMGV